MLPSLIVLEAIVSEKVIDVGSTCEGVAGRLSNFTARRFVFRGVECASIEGVLQALKFEDADEQLRVCGLVGREAKLAGRARNDAWRTRGVLWWQGQVIVRESDEFQQFLEDLFVTVAEQCPDFREDLLTSGDAQLIHSVGSEDKTRTVLTETEFCWLLNWLRGAVRAGVLPYNLKS